MTEPSKLVLGGGRPARDFIAPHAAPEPTSAPSTPPPVTARPEPQPVTPQGDAPALASTPNPTDAKPFLRYDGPASAVRPAASHKFKLAGVTHSYHPFEELSINMDVYLVHDPFGQVVKPETGHPDPVAISVQDARGRHIGYIKAKEVGEVYKGLSSQKFHYRAKIDSMPGGHKGANGEELNQGVHVMIHFIWTKDVKAVAA